MANIMWPTPNYGIQTDPLPPVHVWRLSGNIEAPQPALRGSKKYRKCSSIF